MADKQLEQRYLEALGKAQKLRAEARQKNELAREYEDLAAIIKNAK